MRSIEPHACLVALDTADASAMPGVVAVYTGADLRLELWPLPPRLPIMNDKMVRSMLAHDIVRFVGEPVAVVIATTKAVAMDAAEAVIVDYDPLPVISDIEESRRDEALLHPMPEPTCPTSGRRLHSRTTRLPRATWCSISRYATLD